MAMKKGGWKLEKGGYVWRTPSERPRKKAPPTDYMPPEEDPVRKIVEETQMKKELQMEVLRALVRVESIRFLSQKDRVPTVQELKDWMRVKPDVKYDLDKLELVQDMIEEVMQDELMDLTVEHAKKQAETAGSDQELDQAA